MSHRALITPRFWLGLALGLSLLLGGVGPARAARLVTVEVESVVDMNDRNRGTARKRAFDAALVEAVLEAARPQLERPLVGDEEDQLREALAPAAREAVLTYKVERGSGPRTTRKGQEYVLGLRATVDAEHVASVLREVGWIETRSERPSVVFVTHGEGDAPPVPALLVSFESRLEDRLREEGFVVIEPGLRGGGGGGGGALETGRALGAEVAVEIQVRWKQYGLGNTAQGGSAEVQVRALRTRDGSELASSRFGAPGYHARAEEAQARALESVEPQVADNLARQLGQNWRQLAGDGGAVSLVLVNVGGLGQVDEVRAALVDSLGAREASLSRLGPRTAYLSVDAELSPGALQDRLAGHAFEGFRLEPRSVSVDQVELRVIQVSVDGGTPASRR